MVVTYKAKIGFNFTSGRKRLSNEKGEVFYMLNNYRQIYHIAHDRAEKLKIILVSNIREKTDNFKDYGGTSVISEYLSLSQQELIIESLRSSGFETLCFMDEMDFIQNFITNNCYKEDSKLKMVFNTAQKGTSVGRKSLIPAFCDLYGLCHTNSNPYVVSLARNKYHCSCLLKSNGLPTTNDYLFIPNKGWLFGKRPQKGEKVIVKLNYETSSIGLNSDNIFIYDNSKDLFIKEMAYKYGQSVIVESFIEGYEVEVPIVIGKEPEIVLPVGITVNNQKDLGTQILDYNIRKDLKFGFYNFSETDNELSKKLESCATDVVNLLGITGFGRVDFRIDYNKNIYVTDVATNPHITKGMSFYYAFSENGLDYTQMLETLIALSLLKNNCNIGS